MWQLVTAGQDHGRYLGKRGSRRDFGAGPMLTDAATGEMFKTWFFVMTLCFSRHQYVEMVRDQTVATWLACHRHAFECFGGVPGRVMPDYVACHIIGLMFPGPLCGRRIKFMRNRRGGARISGHITRYRELSHSRRALSSFQAVRVRDAAEDSTVNSQTRSASALARSVSSA